MKLGPRFAVALMLCAVGFGVTGCGSNAATPSATVTITETAVASPSASVSPVAGYPKVVPISSLPERMQTNAREANPNEAVALAPGVWTALPEGTTVEQAAAGGSPFGWCAAVKAYVAQTGRGGYSCH